MPTERKIAVTCRPSNSIEDILSFSKSSIDSGREVMPHIPARQIKTPQHVAEITKSLQALNVRQIFSIAGDNLEPKGSLRGSLDFLNELRRQNIHFDGINIAGYPEGHPKIEEEVLDDNLLGKQKWAKETETGMNIITQMCFDAAAITRWIERIRTLGIKLPVVVGVPGNVSMLSLGKFAGEFGFGDSYKIFKKDPLFLAQLSFEALKSGRHKPDKLLANLSKITSEEHGIRGIHIYTFNNIDKTREWIDEARSFLS
jgi:methylenetetrahydrofolate reductase (NADPH)